MASIQNPTSPDDSADEELIRQVAAENKDALQPLYSRYAPLIYHMAAQTLGANAAEDIVQDVFLQVWDNAPMFDPRRGTFVRGCSRSRIFAF